MNTANPAEQLAAQSAMAALCPLEMFRLLMPFSALCAGTVRCRQGLVRAHWLVTLLLLTIQQGTQTEVVLGTSMDAVSLTVGLLEHAIINKRSKGACSSTGTAS